MATTESMFLPDHLADGVRKATHGGLAILGEEKQVLEDIQPNPQPLPFWQRPLFFFLLVALFTLLPLFPGWPFNGAYVVNVDRVLFISTGLLGVLLLFMWFGTDHASFRNNINLLWAMPLNLLIGFLLPSSKRWQVMYFRMYSFLLLLLFVVIMIMPGIVNQSLIPLIAVLSYRSWINGQKNKKA